MRTAGIHQHIGHRTLSPLEQLHKITTLLDEISVPWVLGGSLASSITGEPRSTMDIDIAVDIRAEQAARLIQATQGDYYISETAVQAAVESKDSFNLIHLATSFKVDVFVLGDGTLDQLQLQQRMSLDVQGQTVWITSPEIQVLRKLSWYDLGGRTSERQWRDVQGILRVQSDRLDIEEVRSIAAQINLTELVERALAEHQRPS